MTRPNCLQDAADAAGDRGRVGNPRLPGRAEKSHEQPSQSGATTQWKRCWKGPSPHPQGQREVSFPPPPQTTGKGGFKFGHRPQAREVLGKAQAHKGTEIRALGSGLEPSFGLKTCLRNQGPSASARAVTDASDAAAVPKLGEESHAKQPLHH